MTWRGLWWGLAATLALVLARIWHLLLLKQVVHDSMRLGAWILLAWGLVGLGILVERRGSAGSAAPRLWTRLSFEVWILLAVFSALVLLFNVGFMRAASDGRGHFAQLHSLVFDRDLDFSDDIREFAARPADSVYPIGTALTWAPLYLLAHAWLGLLNLLGADHLRDGYWNPYQRAVGIGTLLYGLGAMLMIAASLRRVFARSTTIVAVLLTLLATPVVWYVAVDASMSHGVSLFWVTAFLALWIATRDRRTRLQWLMLVIAAGLMILVRLQNVIFLLVLPAEQLLEAAARWRDGDRQGARRLASRLILLGIVAVVGGAAWLFLGPGASGEYVFRERLLSQWVVGLQLFSPHHGLVSNSPVLAFALLGLIALARHDRPLALAFAVVVGLQVLAGGTSFGWNAGASFGARRFVSCALPFAFGLAAAVELARRRPMIPIAALAVGLVAVNLTLVDDARRGDLGLSEAVPFERMTAALSSRVGNPVALPGALLFAWRHDIPVAFYDGIPARKYERLLVNVGAPGDEAYLIGSWFDRERSLAGSFRWATAPEAGIFTQVRKERYRLRFAAQPFVWPNGPVQRVEVYLGRSRVAEIAMSRTLRTYEVELPHIPDDDWVRISFGFSYAVAPRTVIESEDTRPLAALFRSIELEPY